jgi:hypothetical protein
MTEGIKIDAVLTDDESELLAIINGLERQAEAQESKIKKVKQATQLTGLGAVVSFCLGITENNPTGKEEYIIVASALTISGLERFFKERRLEKDIRSKNLLANKLKKELDVTDLERYEYRDIYVPEEEDDEDDPEEDFLFT